MVAFKQRYLEGDEDEDVDSIAPHQLVEDQTTKMLVKFRRIMKNSYMMRYLVYHTNVLFASPT